jgi:hypothetical protein
MAGRNIFRGDSISTTALPRSYHVVKSYRARIYIKIQSRPSIFRFSVITQPDILLQMIMATESEAMLRANHIFLPDARQISQCTSCGLREARSREEPIRSKDNSRPYATNSPAAFVKSTRVYASCLPSRQIQKGRDKRIRLSNSWFARYPSQ